MPHVTLVSDLTASSDWRSFEQLVSLSHLLKQSGHEVSLWLSPEARELDVWPHKAETLSPCPTWSSLEALMSLRFWMHKKTDILHFVPDMRAKRSRTHAFAWLIPVLKGFHNPLVVSSFYSWPEKAPFHLRQLLYLSELVFTPSEYLKRLISADPHSTTFQSFAQIPLLAAHENFETESNYEQLKPFLYMPGYWDEWESPLEQLQKVLQSLDGWPGTLIVGQNWTEHPMQGRALRDLLKQHKTPVFFPESMTPENHAWFTKNAEGVIATGLKLDSLSLSQSLDDCLRWETPVLFSELQADLHSPHLKRAWNQASELKPAQLRSWVENSESKNSVRAKLQKLKASSLQVDPVNQINRMYSMCFSKRT